MNRTSAGSTLPAVPRRARVTLTAALTVLGVLFLPAAAFSTPMSRQQANPPPSGVCNPCPIVDEGINGPCGPNQCPDFLPASPAPTPPAVSANSPGAPSPYAPPDAASPQQGVPGPAPPASAVSAVARTKVLGGRLALALGLCIVLAALVIGVAGLSGRPGRSGPR